MHQLQYYIQHAALSLSDFFLISESSFYRAHAIIVVVTSGEKNGIRVVLDGDTNGTRGRVEVSYKVPGLGDEQVRWLPVRRTGTQLPQCCDMTHWRGRGVQVDHVT